MSLDNGSKGDAQADNPPSQRQETMFVTPRGGFGHEKLIFDNYLHGGDSDGIIVVRIDDSRSAGGGVEVRIGGAHDNLVSIGTNLVKGVSYIVDFAKKSTLQYQ
jgi:hypothetical protein